MAWTYEEAKQHLDTWMAAELACAGGQKYRIGNRELTRADLPEIAKRVDYWKREVERLLNRRRSFRAVPRDL